MKKILVIDDDGPVRAGLVTALRRRGYLAPAASHGAEGLELAFRDPPDLVLCDVNMPRQSGFDVLKELRARPETAAVPVILMTGEPHRADARHSMNQGADDYLLKPFTMEQMLEAVSGRLERQDGIQRALAAQTAAERLSAAEKIRLQTTALEAVANSIVITDPQGKILWVNQAFTRLTGYAAEEVIGQNPRLWNSGRQPPKFFADMWATINAGQVWHGELVNKRKGGGYYHEEMTITPVRDEKGAIRNFVAVKQDVTERKHSELALAHKSDLLLALMDNLPDHIYFKDVQSRYTRVNRAMASHLGLAQPEDAIGKSDADFFPPREARQKLVDERCLLASGKPILGLVERSDAAQETCWVSSTKVPIHGRDGEIAGLVGISRDITEMKQAEEDLRHSEEKFRQLAANVSDVFWISSADHQQILYVSPAYETIWGRSMKSLYEHPHQWVKAILPEERDRVCTLFTALRENTSEVSTEYRISRPDGSVRWVHDRGFQVRDAAGKVVRLAGIASDITERRRLETELFQARKLESIGQLAAGIAHEINTPIQYVGDNVRFMKDSFAAVAKVLDAQAEVLAAARSGSVTPELLARNDAMLAASDLDYLREQIPQALAETLEGVERVAKIIRAMKEFSHPGGKEKAPTNLNKAIESTVTVARNEWKYVADMKLELDDRLPYVDCFLGEFNQAVLNLIVNAAHAIGDVVSLTPGAKGLITILTRDDGDFAEVRVTDTGTGIPEAVRPKIFDPFFTTKDVGKGTGQGLAIVYGAIVNRLGGSVNFETEVGRGTTFILRLPVKPRTKTEAGVPAPAASIA
jgi:PAS domain S-box-containing protein